MDIQEQSDSIPNNTNNNPPSPTKNQVNYYKLSVKSRMSNQSMLSFPQLNESRPYNEKISLESNISQKIRRQENDKELFDQLLYTENNLHDNRGYGSNPYQFKNVEIQKNSMTNQDHQGNWEKKMSMQPELEVKEKLVCKCSKSKCLLMYCQCFSKGLVCNPQCACYQCRNNPDFQDKRQKARMIVLERDPNAFTNKLEMVGGQNLELAHKRGCNCKKTKCMKKYCECFGSGVACTYLCNCENCLNGGENAMKEQML